VLGAITSKGIGSIESESSEQEDNKIANEQTNAINNKFNLCLKYLMMLQCHMDYISKIRQLLLSMV
jgi:hypothetical protein